MSLTDYIIMPGADYQAICDAVRAKTGGTDAIKSGDMAGQIEGIQTVTWQTITEEQTITTTEDSSDSGNYKATIDASVEKVADGTKIKITYDGTEYETYVKTVYKKLASSSVSLANHAGNSKYPTKLFGSSVSMIDNHCSTWPFGIRMSANPFQLYTDDTSEKSHTIKIEIIEV